MDIAAIITSIGTQNPILLIVIVILIFLIPKFADFLTKSRDRETATYKETLKSMQEYTNHLSERLTQLEKEITVWKDKYFEAEESWRERYYRLKQGENEDESHSR